MLHGLDCLKKSKITKEFFILSRMLKNIEEKDISLSLKEKKQYLFLKAMKN